MAGKTFDPYDIASFFYGWIMALQIGFVGNTASNCFYSSFASVEQLDFWVKELLVIWKTFNVFNLVVYTPVHALNNLSAAYE